MKLRYFTKTDAEALLPQITAIFQEGLEIKRLIEGKVNHWRKVHEKLAPSEEAVVRGQVDFLTTQLEQKMGELADLGCVPKDLDMGLVDFPTRIQGKEAYLCWKVGELKIEYWHGLTEGYQGRKILSDEETNDGTN